MQTLYQSLFMSKLNVLGNQEREVLHRKIDVSATNHMRGILLKNDVNKIQMTNILYKHQNC